VGWGGNSRVPPMYYDRAYFAPTAGIIKKALKSTPVLVAHRIVRPEEAEAVIALEDADAVVVVRALIADHEWVAKARTGRADTIRPCTGCNQGCVGQTAHHRPMGCVQDPIVGKEHELPREPFAPASAPKRVVVVGGGPAGLEAAWIAAARGHDVVLLEKGRELGGKIRLAERLPGRSEMGGFATWRAEECVRRGVEIRFGVDATADDIVAMGPDAVIVATGSVNNLELPMLFYPEPPEGHDSPLFVHYAEVVADPERTGRRVVVLDLIGNVQGVGIAQTLAELGRDVTLVMPFPEPTLMESDNMLIALRSAVTAGARFRPRSLVDSITGSTVRLRNLLGAPAEQIDDVDNVVLCGHDRPADSLYFQLLDRVPEVIRVGDAVSPRTVDRAIFDGHMAGREV